MKDAEYELGRYKEKVKRQEKQIQEKQIQDMQEREIGYKQVIDINNAILTALIRMYGADKDSAVMIRKDDVTEAMKRYVVPAEPTEQGDGYLLHYEETGE